MWTLMLCSLALAGDFDGTYAGSGLALTLSDDGSGGYVGSATVEGATYTVNAQPSASGIAGIASAGGEFVSFVGISQGTGFLLTTAEGAAWVVSRTGSAPSVARPTVAQEVVAQTPFATVHADAADALHEALLFSMDFAGSPDSDKQQITRELVYRELASHLSELPPEDQVAIANSRTIWTDTRAGWDHMPITDRREFVGAVLSLAFGESAQAKYGGPAGSSAGASSGPIDVDDLVGIVPGSDCWASAGCNYDSGTGTYEMDTYDYSVPISYDSYE